MGQGTIKYWKVVNIYNSASGQIYKEHTICTVYTTIQAYIKYRKVVNIYNGPPNTKYTMSSSDGHKE